MTPCRLLAASALAAVLLVAPMPASAQASGTCGMPVNQQMMEACTDIIGQAGATDVARSEAHRLRAMGYFELGNMEAARADFTAFIALNPDSVRGYGGRALVNDRLNAFDLAIADASKAISLDPAYASGFATRASAYESLGDYARSRADYDIAIRLQPGNPTYHRRRGMLRKRQADLDGAIADFSDAIRVNPKDYAAFALRGHSRAARKDYERALADFDAALEIEPDDSYAHRGRADVRIQRGDNDGAIADFDVVLADNPNDVGAHVDRGIAFARKGDFANAIPNLDAALKLRPDDPDTRNRRSHMNFIEGHFAEAAADFGDVVAKTPEYGLGKLLRYIARARGGDDDLVELKRNTDAFDRKGWPWPMAALYLGEMTRDEMLARMKVMRLEDNFGRCGVSFYLGQYLMVKRKPQEAMPYLKQAAEVCRGDGEFERDAARGELKRQQASN